MQITFRHACILTRNIDVSVEFYKKNFKLKVLKTQELTGYYPEMLFGISPVKMKYCKMVDSKKNIIEIIQFYQPKDEVPRMSKAHLAFTVEDINKAYEEMNENGVGFIAPPIKASDSKAKVCFCTDPDGNLIEIVEP